MNKKIKFIFLLGIILISNCIYANKITRINLNGITLTSSQAVEENGRTYVSLKVLCKILDIDTIWNKALQEITINQKHNVITIKIGSKLVRSNEKFIELDSPVIIKNGITYVPLRFAEALGFKVSFESSTNEVLLSTGDGNEVPVDNSAENPKDDENGLKPESIDKYGNAFKGRVATDRYNKPYAEVTIAKQSNFPVTFGDITIYDICSKSSKEFYVKIKMNAPDRLAPIVYLSDKNGLNRGRNSLKEEQTKDKSGIITAKYQTIQLSDYSFEGDNFEKFKLSNVKYFVFKSDSGLLAIPASEILLKYQ